MAFDTKASESKSLYFGLRAFENGASELKRRETNAHFACQGDTHGRRWARPFCDALFCSGRLLFRRCKVNSPSKIYLQEAEPKQIAQINC